MSKRPNIRALQMQGTIDRQKRRIFALEGAVQKAIDECQFHADRYEPGFDELLTELRAALAAHGDLSTSVPAHPASPS